MISLQGFLQIRIASDDSHPDLAEGGANLLRLDATGEGESLLELLGNKAAAAFRLGLVLGQHDQHVPLRLDAQLLQEEKLMTGVNAIRSSSND